MDNANWTDWYDIAVTYFSLLGTSITKEVLDTAIWQTSYLPCPANPFPDTEVHKNPGDGQRDRQWHSKLAWFFQAIGHFMHVAPASQSEQQGRLLYTQGHKHAAEEAVFYVSQGCMQDTLKRCCFESKRNQSISYSQNSTTELVRLVVSIMEWFV